jgi:hypothetical protein
MGELLRDQINDKYKDKTIERFLFLVEHSVPFPLNDDYEIELDDAQKEFLKTQHLVFPKNTTIFLVSLDQLVENYKYDKTRTIDNTLLELTDGLILTKEDRNYLTQKLLSKIIS